MNRPSSADWKSEMQVMACLHCSECVNGQFYYPKRIYEPGKGLIENPYQGRCRNCGSREFTIGAVAKPQAEFWEKTGWEFIPWEHPMDIENPALKKNIFIVGG